MLGRICDTCGDNYKTRLAGRDAARDEAKRLAIEKEKPFCVCEEAGEYFPADYGIAIQNRFNIIEVVSGLPNRT